jgi:hypothetical protein
MERAGQVGGSHCNRGRPVRQAGCGAAVMAGGCVDGASLLRYPSTVSEVTLSIVVPLSWLACLQVPGSWTQLTDPPASFSARMVFDTARRRLVLIDQGQTDRLMHVWERSEDRWHRVAAAGAPPGRVGFALAYHPGVRQCLLFGGFAATELGDAWTWDGTAWAQQAGGPQARSSHAMVYSLSTNSVVLCGGHSGSTRLSDTWEWDGRVWRQAAPAPAPVVLASMAYDPVLAGALLLDGIPPNALQGTWLWNGSAWRQVATTGPPPRAGAACSTIWSPPGVLIHGGTGNAAPFGMLSDTWFWNGSQWTALDAGTSMPKRLLGAMTYDYARGQAVLGYGGDLPYCLGDLWSWTGTAWAAFEATPPRRLNAGLVCQENERSLLLFGGGTMNIPTLDDTWILRGNTWVRASPTTQPTSRGAHAMAYDAARGEVVMFGGVHSTGLPPVVDLDDTWVWRQGQWIQRQPTSHPTRRSYPCMAFDRARGEAVLFGGGSWPSLLGDTWTWNGTDWRQVGGTIGGLITPSMAYDEARQKIVVHGRSFPNGLCVAREWDGTSWRGWSPAPDVNGALVYDDRVAGCLLIGQHNVTGGGEAWRWHGGGTWTFVGGHPIRYSDVSAAYDWSRQRTVVFGGNGKDQRDIGVLLGETWIYQLGTLTPRSGRPLLGGTAYWDVALAGSAGLPFLLGLGGGSDGIPVMTHRFGMPILWPVSADRLFRVTFGLSSLLGILSGSGQGTAALALPNDGALDGLHVFASGITLGTSLQPVEVTPAVHVVLTR